MTRPTSRRTARTLHATVAVLALTGVVIELVVAIGDGPLATMYERIWRGLSYFTILANSLVVIVSAMLAFRPDRDGRVFRVLRLDAVLCIVATGVAYHLARLQMPDVQASTAFSNWLLHTGVPIATVLAWLLVGPRHRPRPPDLGWAFALPVGWVVYTYAHGAVMGWYPYPFLDPSYLGYPAALAQTALLAVGFFSLGVALGLVERARPTHRPAPATPRVRPTPPSSVRAANVPHSARGTRLGVSPGR